MSSLKFYIIIFCFLLPIQLLAQDNRIDGMRSDAPELAKPGPYKIGVRTLNLVNKNQIDVLNIEEEKPLPYYDRPLKVEVWYPADTVEVGGDYENVRLRELTVTLHGAAVRNAIPLKDKTFPLVIISHGYPGYRLLMGHFGENLASKGFIAVSIDHTDSLQHNPGLFASTLYNRPYDQKFILSEMNRLANEENNFLYKMVDTKNTGLIGFSMGGYGAVITAGGGLTQKMATTRSLFNDEEETIVSPKNILTNLATDSDSHTMLLDERFKAIIAIGPWGMERDFWDDHGLENVQKPIFFMAGSADDVSGYETGIRNIFEKTKNINRYLLTFENANHGAAAPHPAPKEVPRGDAVWDTLRMNNIAQHFATAYFNKILKGDASMDAYLDLIPNSNDGEGETQWKGFPPRTAKGLRLEYLPDGE